MPVFYALEKRAYTEREVRMEETHRVSHTEYGISARRRLFSNERGEKKLEVGKTHEGQVARHERKNTRTRIF